MIMSGGAGSSFNEAAASDVLFYVSGSVGTKGSSSRAMSLFGGDTFISGALIVSGGNPLGGGTISGSIHLTDTGLSYIRAGNNISVTSGSVNFGSGPSSGFGAGFFLPTIARY